MSTPSNQNPPPGRSTGDQPSQPTGRADAHASGSDQGVSPVDPTRTQWVQVVPAAARPAAAPPDPTPAQWQPAAPPTPAAPPVVPPAAPPVTQKTPRRGPRSFFWPGFTVGFLLLAAVSCGALTAVFGLNRLTLADIRGNNGPAWTPMPVTPTAAIVETAPDTTDNPQPVASSTRFSAGQTVRNATNSRVNIRLTPGYLGKAASDVIGQLEAGQTLQIVGEPTVADELTWWRVQATSNGQTVVGWVAEQTASSVQILSATP